MKKTWLIDVGVINSKFHLGDSQVAKYRFFIFYLSFIRIIYSLLGVKIDILIFYYGKINVSFTIDLLFFNIYFNQYPKQKGSAGEIKICFWKPENVLCHKTWGEDDQGNL